MIIVIISSSPRQNHVVVCYSPSCTHAIVVVVQKGIKNIVVLLLFDMNKPLARSHRRR